MKATAKAALGLCLVAFTVSKAPALEVERLAYSPPIIPVVVFGADQRASIEQYAQAQRLDPATLHRHYASTGIVRCGHAHGSGQLTLTDDVITTAAHVIYDEDGHLRGDSDHCRFIVEAEGQEISTPLDLKTAIVGSTDPYKENAVHDWAAIKLQHPLRDADPYPLGAPKSEEPILFVARGAIDWGQGKTTSMQNCKLREGLEDGAEGTREFAFDCSTNVGASGAGLLDGAGKALLAIFVGYRSVAPDKPLPFSATHYNFAVSIEGEFRKAVERQAALGATAQAK